MATGVNTWGKAVSAKKHRIGFFMCEEKEMSVY